MHRPYHAAKSLRSGHGVVRAKTRFSLNPCDPPVIRIFLRWEAKRGILFLRQRLPHYYYADFVIWDKILLEAKAVEKLT